MKKRIIILGSILALLLVGWTVAWFVLAGVVRQNVEVMAANDGLTAPRLVCGRLDVGGFPFRFDLGCGDAQVTLADLTVELPLLEATTRVYSPFHLIAKATGPAVARDSFTGASNEVAWSSLDASVRISNWRIARLSLVGADVVWTDTLLSRSELGRAGTVELHLMDIPEAHDPDRQLAALAGYGRATGIVAPAARVTDGAVEVQVELTGLPDDLRLWGDPQLLQTVAANGGRMQIVAIRATDQESELNATGELGLDAAGLINGQISIDSLGVAERIGPMLQEPWRTLVLGVPGEDGRHSNQLNFNAGTVASGPVPIGAIPALF